MIGRVGPKEKRWRRANCFDLVPLHLRCSALIVEVVTQIGALDLELGTALDLEALCPEALAPGSVLCAQHEVTEACSDRYVPAYVLAPGWNMNFHLALQEACSHCSFPPNEVSPFVSCFSSAFSRVDWKEADDIFLAPV